MANSLDRYLAIWQVLGMTLSEYLAQHSIKVSAFAERVGVPPSTISRVIKRQRDPGLDLLAKIMEATHGEVTPNDFLATPDQRGQLRPSPDASVELRAVHSRAEDAA
jgi:predicted transcriptional regulator